MYPKNAVTPPRIAIGPVVQISDGAVQSSGVSVVVRAEGGSETAGGGTISYGASSGVVYYAPTQAETNHTAFVVTAFKTGCIPASVSIVTSAEATAGTVQVGSLATDSVDADALASDAVTEIQSGLSTLTSANVSTAVWDAAVASYSSVGGSFGKSFKNLSDGVISVDGSVNDVSATASSFVTDLSSAVDDYYNDKILTFTSGSLIGQSRIIHDYVGITKTVSFDESFTSAPQNGDDFVLLAIHQHTLTQINNEVLDVVNVDTLVAGQTVAESLRRIGAITSGEVSNAGTSQETFKDYAASGSTIVVTVDASGNRTGITYN